MIWRQSYRADPRARELADRHYSRQKIGAAQFCPAGSAFVLYAATATGRAYWVTSFPLAEWVKHAWAGAWICSAFRNEGAGLSSDLIRQAVAATRWRYGEPPALGMVTFVDPRKVRSSNPGFCFLKAGFRRVGKTGGGLPALQLLPTDMPAAVAPPGSQSRLFDLLPAAMPASA
jgi:hypothetical protein